jgi:hypothetical protein
MTTTQAVCESMGWDNDAVSIFAPGIGCIGLFDDLGKDTPNGNWLVKALQARLVEEGWSIHIIQYTKNNFEAYGVTIRHPGVIETASDYQTEPAAIVQLYCKIHGIEVGNE